MGLSLIIIGITNGTARVIYRLVGSELLNLFPTLSSSYERDAEVCLRDPGEKKTGGRPRACSYRLTQINQVLHDYGVEGTRGGVDCHAHRGRYGGFPQTSHGMHSPRVPF